MTILKNVAKYKEIQKLFCLPGLYDKLKEFI